MHPAVGIAVSPELSDLSLPPNEPKNRLPLVPWAALVTELGPEEGEKQSVSIRTQMHKQWGNYPELEFTQYWSDLKRNKSGDKFGFTHVPPMLDTSISHDIEQPDGSSTGITAASVNLLSGESRQFGLGPLSDKQREQLKSNREELQKLRDEAAPQSSDNKSSNQIVGVVKIGQSLISVPEDQSPVKATSLAEPRQAPENESAQSRGESQPRTEATREQRSAGKTVPSDGSTDPYAIPSTGENKNDALSPAGAEVKKPTIVPNTQPVKENAAPVAPTVAVFQPRGDSNYIEVKCVDVAGRPLENVKVRTYRMNGISGERPQALAVSFTGSKGDHTFSHVIQLDSYPWVRDYPDGKIEQRPGVYEHQIMIVANSPGRASIMTGFPESAVFRSGAKIELPMREAAALTGRVTDTNSMPIAGAIVSLNYAGIGDFQSASTDKDGRYTVEDATTMDWGQTKRELENKSKASLGDWGHAEFGPPELIVRHPDYAEKSVPYARVPSSVDIELERGGRIKGRVVLADADKGTERLPIAERFPVTVRFDNKTESIIPSSQRAASQLAARTDAEGYYEIGSLRPGKFSIYGEALGWFNSGVNAGLTEVEVRANETTTAPDLVLQKGTTVHVQLIDAASNRQLAG